MKSFLLFFVVLILSAWSRIPARSTKPTDSLIDEFKEIVFTAKQPKTKQVIIILFSTIVRARNILGNFGISSMLLS